MKNLQEQSNSKGPDLHTLVYGPAEAEVNNLTTFTPKFTIDLLPNVPTMFPDRRYKIDGLLTGSRRQ